VLLVHRTPREAKAVYPSDWMQMFTVIDPVKVFEEAIRKWVVAYTGGPLH